MIWANHVLKHGVVSTEHRVGRCRGWSPYLPLKMHISSAPPLYPDRANVCVVGIGGVGSWAAEALARSGVGSITLADMDEVLPPPLSLILAPARP